MGPLILQWRKIFLNNHGLPGVEGIRHHSFDGHPESRSYMIIFVCPKCFQRNNLIFGINAFRVPGFMLVETVLSLGCTMMYVEAATSNIFSIRMMAVKSRWAPKVSLAPRYVVFPPAKLSRPGVAQGPLKENVAANTLPLKMVLQNCMDVNSKCTSVVEWWKTTRIVTTAKRGLYNHTRSWKALKCLNAPCTPSLTYIHPGLCPWRSNVNGVWMILSTIMPSSNILSIRFFHSSRIGAFTPETAGTGLLTPSPFFTTWNAKQSKHVHFHCTPFVPCQLTRKCLHWIASGPSVACTDLGEWSVSLLPTLASQRMGSASADPVPASRTRTAAPWLRDA